MELPLKLQVLGLAWQQVTGDGMKPGAGVEGWFGARAGL